MELKVNREVITVCEELYSGVQEQSTELDYILPDYFPEIFRIIQARMEPRIESYAISDGVLTYELCVEICVLYCAQDSPAVHCVRQKLCYTRTVELGRQCEGIAAELIPKPDYVNCRAVNQRRIDLRGAVSVRIRATCGSQQEVIGDIFGLHAQTRKEPVTYTARRLHGVRTFTLSEVAELGEAKPAALQILRTDVQLLGGDARIIAGKLAAKGDAVVRLLYSCEGGMESMQFTLPYSQIVDLEGIDDAFSCTVRPELAGCEITPAAKNDGEARSIQCELRIRLVCTAVKTAVTELVTDVFSTLHPCSYTAAPVRLSGCGAPVSDSGAERCTLVSKEGEIRRVYDVWCTPRNMGARALPESGSIEVSGMLACSVLAQSDSTAPVMLEQEFPFTRVLPAPEDCTAAQVQVQIPACSYTLTGSDTVVLQPELRILADTQVLRSIPLLTEVHIDQEERIAPKDSCALLLYYGTAGEAVWDIAKKYSTSIQAIVEENDLTQERLTENGMLLIPLVDRR